MPDQDPVPAGRLHLGAAYYPEHWPEERWAEDIRLMREAGLSVVRMGEFAWSTFEPVEGEFHFDWMERAITQLAEAGILTVMGTPTAAPPAWLVQKYPDSLAVDEQGQRLQFGNRCHYCVNSPDIHAASERIVSAMAERFGDNSHVIGWQIDNEYNRVCYCERCQKRFQEFLAQKYGTLDELNRRWSTAYWSQTYSAWDQIPIPIGGHNPGLMLEFKRFIGDSYRRFQRLQLDALRPHLAADVWVTHNFMGWYDGFDHYALTEDLDIAAWDYYVGTGHHDYAAHAARHDLTRGFKRRNFWLMETQPGHVNWSTVNNVLNKGEARAVAWQAVGHGADAVLYWQWRSALGGQEQYHGSLVDPSGQPRPFYTEAQQIGREFAVASPLLAGSKVAPARIAILNDYESRWSIQWQRHHRDFDYVAHLTDYYRPLVARSIPVDILSADADLTGYSVVLAPSLLLMDDARAARLIEYVQRGGYLALTIRCAMKDRDNAFLPSRQPGPLAAISGVEVEDYYALDEPVPVIGNWFTGQSSLWAERLKIIDEKRTSAIAKYSAANGWLDNQLAITVHGHGSGLVYYIGCYLDPASMSQFMERMLNMGRIRQLMILPPGVEICTRLTPQNTEVYLMINHERAPQRVTLPWQVYEHLSGQTLSGDVQLAPYGVAIFTRAY